MVIILFVFLADGDFSDEDGSYGGGDDDGDDDDSALYFF